MCKGLLVMIKVFFINVDGKCDERPHFLLSPTSIDYYLPFFLIIRTVRVKIYTYTCYYRDNCCLSKGVVDMKRNIMVENESINHCIHLL